MSEARTPRAAPVALTLVVAALWIPGLRLPMGSSHDGVITARFALHARNFVEDGFAGSSYLASAQPYTDVYANHPPLPHFAQGAVGAVFGAGDFQARLFPFATGVLAIAAVYLFARALGHRASTSLLSTFVVVTTPMFWIYARILWDVPLLFLVPVLAIRACGPDESKRIAATLFALVSLAAALSSYIGLAFAGGFWAWVCARDQRSALCARPLPLLSVGAAIGIGFALTLAWQAAASVGSGFGARVVERSTGGDVSAEAFVDRNLEYVFDLYSIPLVLLAAIGMVGIRGSVLQRQVVALSAALAALLVFAFPYGAYVHEYWSYPALVALAALAARGVDHVRRLCVARYPRRVVATVGATLCALLLASAAFGPVQRRNLNQAEAGALAKDNPPAEGQSVAWSDMTVARWLAYYWNLPTDIADPTDPRANDDDLVLLYESTATENGVEAAEIVDRSGSFVIVRMGALRP